jgi:hypothetical protein
MSRSAGIPLHKRIYDSVRGINRASLPAQQAHAADRFAREIIAILTVFVVRLRRLMGKPLGRP